MAHQSAELCKRILGDQRGGIGLRSAIHQGSGAAKTRLEFAARVHPFSAPLEFASGKDITSQRKLSWGEWLWSGVQTFLPFALGTVARSESAVVTVGATYDKAHTISRHTADGAQVLRDLRGGKEAHIFDEGVDIEDLIQKVWTEGTYTGNIRYHDRFVWRSPTPIGRRIQGGRIDIPLHWVEIKVKSNGIFYPIPRTGPANF